MSQNAIFTKFFLLICKLDVEVKIFKASLIAAFSGLLSRQVLSWPSFSLQITVFTGLLAAFPIAVPTFCIVFCTRRPGAPPAFVLNSATASIASATG